MRRLGTPCRAGVPLSITAELAAPVVFHRPVALDAMLMAAVAYVEGAPPVEVEEVAIDIPLEERGGIYLCTLALGDVLYRSTSYRNRPVPLARLLQLGQVKPKYNVVAGRGKPTRIPEEHKLMRALRWYCIGDAERITALLRTVSSVGARRGAGMGVIKAWEVAPAEAWAGFPVLDESGLPLRPLPLDWPGLTGGMRGFERLRPPYWRRDGSEEVMTC